MVRFAEYLSLRLPSCCNELVTNGADGFCVNGRSSTESTLPSPRTIASRNSKACCFFKCSKSSLAFSRPVSGSKSRPSANRLSPTSVSSVSTVSPEALANTPFMPQNSAARKRIRARSRSESNFTAMLCTRPALNPGAIFFHNNGLTS